MPDVNDDVLQKLAPSIVEIICGEEEGKQSSTTLGTGFVVTDDGLIVTCRHVIADSRNKLMNSVRVRFHSNGKTDTKDFGASLLKASDDFEEDPSVDIAFLRLDKVPEKGVIPVKLDDKVVSLNHFASIGFKKAEEFTRLAAKGEIRILTQNRISKDVVSPEVIQLHSPNNDIEPGMSGAPLLDIERDRVVGIISERYIEQYNVAAASNMAFALPVKAMVELYPILREKNQGLTVLSKFLRAIGEERSSIYKWIDEVYVPPLEYDEIKAALKRDRIVFITGTKEFGKTFTAVRLMYEFFKEGNYQSRWVHERNQQGLREGSDPQKLARIVREEGYIKPHQMVYFEDPFGKTQYERSSDLEDRIASIIDSIKYVRDVYVIITSREEVFKEFQRQQLSSIELASFEKKMNLKKASYDSEKRKEMLLRWAKVYNCKWLLDTALKALVLHAIEKGQLLPTPLNIKDFAIASHDILDSNLLMDLMKQKSEETSRQFAHEIMRMEEDEKILFLTFAYVGFERLEMNLVKKKYENIIRSKEAGQEYYMDFDAVKKWFEGDKIDISDNRLAFSHPSYYEALQYAIDSEKRESLRIREIFIKVIKVLLRVVNEDLVAGVIATAIAMHFNKLPPHIQQLLFKLVKHKSDLLLITSAIAENFNKLPPHIQQLLFKLAYNDRTAGDVAFSIVATFPRTPLKVQQLLFKLADNDKAAGAVGTAMMLYNRRTLPAAVMERLLLKLADNDKAAASVAYTVARNFNKLPPHIQQLLFKLADNDKAASMIANGIHRNFNNLPPNIREQLLLKIADNDEAAAHVAIAITYNFNKLPPNVQQLLFKLADNDKAASDVASAITANFNNLPTNVQQLLFKLADNDKAAYHIATGIAHNFDQLPSNIQQLLFKLADNDRAAETVTFVMEVYRNSIPDNIRKEILAKAKKTKKKRRRTRRRLSK